MNSRIQYLVSDYPENRSITEQHCTHSTLLPTVIRSCLLGDLRTGLADLMLIVELKGEMDAGLS